MSNAEKELDEMLKKAGSLQNATPEERLEFIRKGRSTKTPDEVADEYIESMTKAYEAFKLLKTDESKILLFAFTIVSCNTEVVTAMELTAKWTEIYNLLGINPELQVRGTISETAKRLKDLQVKLLERYKEVIKKEEENELPNNQG